MIAFRHVALLKAFLWAESSQPAGRWHAEGEGPVQYLSDTPDGAWAEFLRSEGIFDVADLRAVRRTLWAVDIGTEELATPRLPLGILTGGLETWETCRQEASRLRAAGATGLRARSAALKPGMARGLRVDGGGLVPGDERSGDTIVLFGPRPDLVGWRAAFLGRPGEDLLEAVRYFGAVG